MTTGAQEVPHRRTGRLALGAAALTAVVGAVLVLVADGSVGDGGFGFVALVPLFVGHLWATRRRTLLSVVLTLVPGLLVSAAVLTTARSDDGPAAGLVFVTAGAMTTLVTVAVAGWVANRWGRRRRFSPSDLGHMPT